ncbi:hypothetical protein [Acidianus sp. HS-5]|uniref:hypothetical protein n=1 Tax=Acidianus sp. HS-5 TaxID=2886040 RepID=UPI001F299811|nr:hypothetical protein [Acidianus sp. HS-5]
MENEVLSKKSPLYGRTKSWKVTQIPFPYLSQFSPEKGIEDLIMEYSRESPILYSSAREKQEC